MKRKLLAILLALSMLMSFGLVSAAEVSDFNDLPAPGHWAYEGVTSVIRNGIMEGYGDGSFQPDGVITLAEASAYIVRAMKATVKAADLTGISGYASGSWYDTQGVVAIAYNMGILDGIIKVYGGNVTPDTPLTSGDAFDMMARTVLVSGGNTQALAKFADAADTNSVYAENIAALVESGYILGSADNGVLNLAPLKPVTRARFATLFERLFGDYITAPGVYSNKMFGGTVVNVRDVTLKDTVINGDLTIGDGVGSGDVTLDNVTVNGRLIVRGGGTDSIIIINSSITGNITISRVDGAVRVYVDGSEVEYIYVNDGKDDVIIEGTVGTVTVADDVPVHIKGAAGTLIVTAQDADVTFANGSTVGSVSVEETAVNASVKFEGTAEAGNIGISAKDVDLNVAGNSTIDNLTIGSTATGAKVTGSGTIDNTVINAPGTNLSDSLKTGTVTDNTQTSSDTSGSGGTGGGETSGSNVPLPAPIVHAVKPVITTQPASASYEVDTKAAALTVTASVSDLGTLSYQWFSNTENSAAGGTAISGATGNAYTPDTSVTGTVYYYVVVTNTNNSVNGDKTASVTSAVAAVVTEPEEVLAEFTYIITPDGNYVAGEDADPQTVVLTASGLNDLWYEFDLGTIGYSGKSLALYFKNGGSVMFNIDVTLRKTVSDGSSGYTALTEDVEAGQTITMSADWNEYAISLDNSSSVILIYAPDAGNYASLTPDKPLSEFPGTITLGDAPDSVVTEMMVGAARDGVFAEREEITIEKGTSINLMALMKVSVSVLLRENRDVTWTVNAGATAVTSEVSRSIEIAGLKSTVFVGSSQLSITGKQAGSFTVTVSSDYSEAQAAGAVSKTITVNVVEPVQRPAPVITVTSDGVQDWTYDPVAAQTYLGFTADVHYDRTAAAGENLYRLWMENLRSKGITLDYMSLVGDNISAYASGDAAWENMRAIIDLADSFSPDFVTNETLFLMGNHERWESGGMHYDATKDAHPDVAARLSQNGAVYGTADGGYVLYDFGASKTPDGSPYYGGSYGGNGAQEFMDDEIDALDAYLCSVPSDVPVFVMSHYPIHTYISPEGSERESGNAAKVVNVLNKYPNVIFLWGHNHSSADPKYDHVLDHGDIIEIGSLAFGESVRINFVYADAGCMSDFEYRSSQTSTSIPGGALIQGKSMVAAVNGTDVTLMWYNRPAIPQPEFNFPVEITNAVDGMDVETITLFGSAEYRILTKGVETHEWYDATMYTWSASLLASTTDVVIAGFRSADDSPLDDLASISNLTGYGNMITNASAIEAGNWAVIANADSTMVFVIMNTVSDKNIWLPGELPGGELVWDLRDYTVKIYGDPVSSTWQQLLDSVMMIEPDAAIVSATDGSPVDDLNAVIDCNSAYVLRAGENDYQILNQEPVFTLPEDLQGVVPGELAKAIYKSGNNYELYVGYTAYFAENEDSSSAIWFTNGMTQTSAQTALGSLGENLLILCISPCTATALPDSIRAYGGAPVSTGSSFTTLSNTPNSWAYYISSNRAFVLINRLSGDATAFMQDAGDVTVWRGYNAYANRTEDGWDSLTIENAANLSVLGKNLSIIGVKPTNQSAVISEITGYAQAASIAEFITSTKCWFLLHEADASFLLINNRVSPYDVDFAIPAELAAFLNTSSIEYEIWHGYTDFSANADSFGSIFGGMGSTAFGANINALAESIIIIGVLDADNYPSSGNAMGLALYELEIANYGNKALSHGTNTLGGGSAAAALASVSDNSWVVVSSSSFAHAYIVFSRIDDVA